MALLFEGKVVFVTGASSGIGAALAKEFARHGAKVAMAARRTERLAEVEQAISGTGSDVIALCCDVTDRASVDAAVSATVSAFAGIDVVVANAGFGVSGDMKKLETEDYRRQFETNFFGVLETIYATLPHLEASKGRLGIVSSVMGRVGVPGSAPYCASKFALVGLAESIYYDLAECGVSVSCINPGIVASEIRSVNNQGVYTGKRDRVSSRIKMPAETAARHIVRGLYRRKAEFVITKHGKVVSFASRHFPRTTRLVIRMASKGRLEKIEEHKRGKVNQG